MAVRRRWISCTWIKSSIFLALETTKGPALQNPISRTAIVSNSASSVWNREKELRLCWSRSFMAPRKPLSRLCSRSH